MTQYSIIGNHVDLIIAKVFLKVKTNHFRESNALHDELIQKYFLANLYIYY